QNTKSTIEMVQELTLGIGSMLQDSNYPVTLQVGPFSYTSYQDGTLAKRLDTKRDPSSDLGLFRSDIIRRLEGCSFKGRMSPSGSIDIGDSMANFYKDSPDAQLARTDLKIAESFLSNVRINIFGDFPDRESFRVGETF